MKCPYTNPTIQQCESCSFDDCIWDECQKAKERHKRYRDRHPERVRAIIRKAGKKYRESHREQERLRNHINYLERKARLRERQAG
jgi:acyl-CoA reductase-like NAD-dependent aldehyde dehydrogenase